MCAAIIHIFNIKKKQNKLKPIYLKFNLRKTCCCQQVTRRQVHKWLSRICPAANEQFNNIVRFQQAGRGVVFHIFLRFLFWPLNFYFFLDFFFVGRWKTGTLVSHFPSSEHSNDAVSFVFLTQVEPCFLRLIELNLNEIGKKFK